MAASGMMDSIGARIMVSHFVLNITEYLFFIPGTYVLVQGCFAKSINFFE